MSYWSISFVSLKGVSYEVRIYGRSTSSISLLPAAEPLVIQEDSSDDVFLPVRKQTGYICIEIPSSGRYNFDYQDILPTNNLDRPVTVLKNGTAIWAGFLKAQNFNLPFTDRNITLSLPIIDAWSAMSNIPFDPGYSAATMNVAACLLYCINQMNSYSNESVDTLVISADSEGLGWLRGYLSTGAFYDIDDDGNRSVRYTCSEILENMCTFAGISFRVHNLIGYFLTAADNDADRSFYGITLQQLRTIAEGDEITPIEGSLTSVEVFDNASRPYASTNQKLTIRQGITKATVSCQRDVISLSWSMPSEEIADKYFMENTPTYEDVGSNRVYTLYNSILDAVTNNSWQFIPGRYDTYLHIFDVNPSHTFNWIVGLHVDSNTPTASRHFTLRSAYPVKLRDCVVELQMSGGVYTDGEMSDGNFYAYVGISCDGCSCGGNNTSWSSVSENIYGAAEFSDGGIVCTRLLSSRGADYTGYGFDVNENTLPSGVTYLYGYLEVHLYAASKDVDFTAITVNILPNDRDVSEQSDDQEFTSSSDNGFDGTMKKSCIFCYGESFSNYLNNAIYNGAYPQTLANLMLAQYGSVRSVFKLNLLTSIVTLTPMNTVPRDSDGKTYYPVSISHNYREDIDEVVLEEIIEP